MEAFPFRLFLVVLIMVFVVSTSSLVTTFFLNFYREQAFNNDVESLVLGIETLADIADYGSFDLVSVNVPFGAFVYVDNVTDSISTQNTVYNVSVDIINSLNLTYGTYNIELYYGELGEIKPYTIVFR